MEGKTFRMEEQPKVAQDPVGVLIEQIKDTPGFSDSSLDFDFSFLSPEQRAESMWSIFNDLKGGKRKRLQIKNELEKSRVESSDDDSKELDETKNAEHAYLKPIYLESGLKVANEKEKKLTEEEKINYAMLSWLYNDQATRQAYLEANGRHLREGSVINGDKEKYHDLKKKVGELEEVFDLSLKNIFSKRQGSVPESQTLLFEINKRQLERARTELDLLLDSNPKLQALSQYEDIRRLSGEIRKDGFGRVPSRRRLSEKIENVVATVQEPILLSGGSGTGKTKLVEVTSLMFTEQTIRKEVCSDETNFESLIARSTFTQTPEGERAYYNFGPLGQALTGKTTSLDTESDGGGIVFLDEFNLLPQKIQLQILAFVEKCKPGEKVRIPVVNTEVVVADDFVFMAAINPAGSRFASGRSRLPEAVSRKFHEISIDYAKQTPKDPEIYELMLATLTDNNGRMVGAKEELSPEYEWKEETREVLSKSGEVTQRVRTRVFKENDDTSGVLKPAGGFLWRFAQAIGEINKSVSDKETVLKVKGRTQFMKELVIDIGKIVGWLNAYVKTGKSETLEYFLITKLYEQFLGDDISKYTKEDKDLAVDFFKYFGIETDPEKITKTKPKEEIMTPVQMGLLSPRVDYFEVVSEEPSITESYYIDQNGNRVEYLIKEGVEEGKVFKPGCVLRWPNGMQLLFHGVEKVSGNNYYTNYSKEPVTPETPSNPETPTLQEAREILGDRVFGPEQVEQAFGIHIENVPNIPYTREQLEQAERKGMDLVLYTDKLKDGKDLTGLSLYNHLQQKQKDGSKLLFNTDWYKDEPFFTTETPQSPQNQGTYWKLVSREVIPNSTNQNYLEQTQTLANYIRSLYNEDPANPKDIPPDIQQALNEFEDLLKNEPQLKDKVTSTDETIWKPVAQTLANLKLTELFRESFIENLYRLTLTDRTKAQNVAQLLLSMYSWTKTLASGGRLVDSGLFDGTGAAVDGRGPGRSDSPVGCSFSAVFL